MFFGSSVVQEYSGIADLGMRVTLMASKRQQKKQWLVARDPWSSRIAN